MAPRKKVIGDATSKEKTNATARGAASKGINNQPFMESTAFATLQESSVSTQPPQQQENQLFQMFWEMKEQMKE